MIARGPDGEGLWLADGGRLGLAHRRLTIIDLSPAGAQPMAHGTRDLHITYNGEIYNYQRLRDELIGQGHAFRSQSDTEVLLHLYERDGPAMTQALRGMYSFAIWDGMKRGLFLARDPFGIKPLYYADHGGTFRFASQVKALLAGGGVDRAPEPAGHVGFHLWGYVPEPYTLFAAIRGLPAGSSLWVDASGAQTAKRFFDVAGEFAQASERPVTHDLRDAQLRDAQLRDVLADSVAHHLVADVPVGVFMSAGLDSSTLLGLASERADEPLRTVTLAFDEYAGTDRDEAPLAAETAQLYGADHRTQRVGGADFAAHREALLKAMDQPSIDGVNSYFVAKVTAETGLKVALSGLGGDELFGGYPSFRQLPRLVAALGPLRPLRALGRGLRLVAAPLVRHFTSPKYASLLELGTSYGDAYLLRRGLYMPWELPAVLDGEMVRDGWRELDSLARLETGLANPRAAVSALEIGWYMRNQLLRDADWAGMAHSLEIRTPLVDVDLFRALAPMLVSAAPPSKRDMAMTPRPALPGAVIERPKTGFSVPVRDWLRGGTAGERGLRGWARQVHKLCYAQQ